MSHYLRDIIWEGRDELKMTHYEISPREKEDEARDHDREFSTEGMREEDDQGKAHLRHGNPGEQDTP